MTKRNISLARGLRRRQTEVEKMLWKALRGKQLSGCKFRRQEPIGNYIVDFICYEKRLIIELDGGQHYENDADKVRDEFFEKQGYVVFRFWNCDITSNFNGVLEMIYRHCRKEEKK